MRDSNLLTYIVGYGWPYRETNMVFVVVEEVSSKVWESEGGCPFACGKRHK